MWRHRLRRMYVRGSLVNVDFNGDGKPDGFQFQFIAPGIISLYEIYDLNLSVDGEKINSSNILIHLNGKTYSVGDLVKSQDYCLLGDEVTIIVKKKGLTSDKEHFIKLSAIGSFVNRKDSELPLVLASDFLKNQILDLSRSKKIAWWLG